ncbi:hypothetical protein Pelo_1589 [Pelomyxa schiedti]|nr:hypothetical protein Pelo_1589 [Pelomyxa schiedti]
MCPHSTLKKFQSLFLWNVWSGLLGPSTAAATTATTPAPNPPTPQPPGQHTPQQTAAACCAASRARVRPSTAPLAPVRGTAPIARSPASPMSLDHTAPPDYLRASSPPPTSTTTTSSSGTATSASSSLGIGGGGTPGVVVSPRNTPQPQDDASAVAVDIPPPPPEHVRPSPPNKELPAIPQREPSGHAREQPQPQQQPQGPLSVSDTGGVASGLLLALLSILVLPSQFHRDLRAAAAAAGLRAIAGHSPQRQLISVASGASYRQATADADHPLHDKTVHAAINLPPKLPRMSPTYSWKAFSSICQFEL